MKYKHADGGNGMIHYDVIIQNIRAPVLLLLETKLCPQSFNFVTIFLWNTTTTGTLDIVGTMSNYPI